MRGSRRNEQHIRKNLGGLREFLKYGGLRERLPWGECKSAGSLCCVQCAKPMGARKGVALLSFTLKNITELNPNTYIWDC